MGGWPVVFVRTERFLPCVLPCVVVLFLGLANRADAGFVSQFSLSASEEYNDNILFTDQTEADWITAIKPAVGVFYKPSKEKAPTFSAVVETVGQIFARNSQFNNFGKNTFFNTGYIHRHSRNLNFHLSNTLRRVGDTRTQSAVPDSASELSLLPTQFPTTGAAAPLPVFAGSGDLTSLGETLGNFFSARGRYQYRPNLSFTGRFSAAYKEFFDEGGSESSQLVATRAVYKWGRKHNFHLGFSIRGIQPRNGENDVVFDFDFGDDYFTRFDFQLTPTLKLSGRTGVSFAGRSSGPQVANRSSVDLDRIWKKARLRAGFRHGLTSSLGVSGISRTTTVFGNFTIQFARPLSGVLGVTYSYFDTDNDFSTVRANASLQYWILYWLRADLRYGYWMRNGGSGGSSRIIAGVNNNPSSNGIFLRLTARFDAYPKFGLAKWVPFR